MIVKPPFLNNKIEYEVYKQKAILSRYWTSIVLTKDLGVIGTKTRTIYYRYEMISGMTYVKIWFLL